MKKLWTFKIWDFSINRNSIFFLEKSFFRNIPKNSGKELPRPRNPLTRPVNSTRSEKPLPATYRRCHRPRPTRLGLAVLSFAFSFVDRRRRSPIGLARFRVKYRRSNLPITATSDQATSQVLLLSSRSIDPWWWIIKFRLVEIGSTLGISDHSMCQSLSRPLQVRISL